MASATTAACLKAMKRNADDLLQGQAHASGVGPNSRVTRRRTTGDTSAASCPAAEAPAAPAQAKVSPQAANGAWQQQQQPQQLQQQPAQAAPAAATPAGCAMGFPCKGSAPKPIQGPVLGVPSLPLGPKGCMPPFPMGMPGAGPAHAMMMMMMLQQQQMAMSAMMCGGMPNPAMMGMPMMPPAFGAMMGMGPSAAGVPPMLGAPAAAHSMLGAPTPAMPAMGPMGLPITPFPGMPLPHALPGAPAPPMGNPFAAPAAHMCSSMVQPPALHAPTGLACATAATTTVSAQQACPSRGPCELEAKHSCCPSDTPTDSSAQSSGEHVGTAAGAGGEHDHEFASFISSFLVPGAADAPAAPHTGDPVLDLQLDLSDLMEGGEGLVAGPLGLSLSHETLLEALASTC